MDITALFKITQGVYILGATDGSRFIGRTMDAVMQAASKPPVIAISCLNIGYTRDKIEETGRFSLSVLGEKVDPFVIANFGYQSSREVDKWKNVAYEEKDGLPILTDAAAGLIAEVIEKKVFESHTVFFGEVKDAWRTKEEACLTYRAYQDGFKTKVMEAFQSFKKGE